MKTYNASNIRRGSREVPAGLRTTIGVSGKLIGRQHDVRRFYVTMHDSHGVTGGQRGGNLNSSLQRLTNLQTAIGKALP